MDFYKNYLQHIKKYPILTQEEEYNLAVAYRETKSKEIADKLIGSHLRLVVKVAEKYRGYGLCFEELISEGNIGLMLALEKFEPQKGFRFSTYALWWIRASIQKYVLSSWSLVKIGTTIAQKKLFFNLKKIKAQLKIYDDKQLNAETMTQIAGMLGVGNGDVKDMNARISSHDSSLNICIGEDGEAEIIDFIKDNRPNQEDVLILKQLKEKKIKVFQDAFHVLNLRERDILTKRRLQEKAKTLDEISNIYGISKERVRQIEVQSIKKLQQEIDFAV